MWLGQKSVVKMRHNVAYFLVQTHLLCCINTFAPHPKMRCGNVQNCTRTVPTF